MEHLPHSDPNTNKITTGITEKAKARNKLLVPVGRGGLVSPRCVVNSGCFVLSVSRFHSDACGEGVRLAMKSKSSSAKEMSSVSSTMDIKSSSFSSSNSLNIVLIDMVRVGSGYGSKRFSLVGRVSALGMSFCSAKEHV